MITFYRFCSSAHTDWYLLSIGHIYFLLDVCNVSHIYQITLMALQKRLAADSLF